VKDSLARRLLLAALAVAVFLVLSEGVLSWLNAFLKARERVTERPPPEAQIAQHDAELGWTNVPGKQVRNLYGAGRDFTANAQGFRAREEYGASVPPGRCRAVFAGDSFTMGFGVGDADTYPAQIERLDSRMQSVNLGMGAYGADQAFLRYRRDAASLAHDVAVFAFIAHDLRRMEKSFYMAPKPQLALRDGELVVANAPVPERDSGEDARTALRAFLQNLDLGKALARIVSAAAPTPSQAELDRGAADHAEIRAAPIAEAMFGELAALARERGAGLLLVYLPTRGDLASEVQPIRDWSSGVATARGVRFVDATPSFRGREAAPLFGLDNHYSEAGNALVAEALLPAIRDLCAFSEASSSERDADSRVPARPRAGQSGSDPD
jgi:hypothetical protein